ncbi:MAG: hypothetical protein O3C45_10795, partial [Bacteroidetes bacterium]|nr:hypothetical protein [Bacteroidota bacterium]
MAGPALGQDIRTVDGVQYFVQEWKASTSAGNLIQLEDIGGGIDIGPSNDGQLRLELRVPVGGRSRPEALAYGREFAPLLKPGPDGVHVEGRGAPMGARYLIQIPRDTRVALDTDGGSINIHDVRASFRIDRA